MKFNQTEISLSDEEIKRLFESPKCIKCGHLETFHNFRYGHGTCMIDQCKCPYYTIGSEPERK